MLALGGLVYLSWWFAVEWLLPGSFNPLPGRLLVVAYFFAAYAAGRASTAVASRAEPLYYLGASLLTCHYFYLFAHNAADPNWSVGTYIVVFALFIGIASRAWLIAFAVLVLGSASIVVLLEPALQRNIFLPGLATIVALCLLMLLSRIRLLESLSESTARFHSLYDASFEGVAVQDAGKIIDVNASFATLFGYTREELIGRSVVELNAAPHRERVSKQIRDVPVSRYESVGLRKDGSRFAIEISTKPHVYGGRMLRLAAVRDVSDRLRAEEERAALIHEQAARASALEAVRLRDEFISIASHELRTPITSLLLNLDVFVRRARGGGPVEFETYAARVRRQLGRMQRLVEELLDVSRLSDGPLTLQREQVDLSQLAGEVLDALSEDLKRAGCVAQLHADAPVLGIWDRLRLEQVVENLVRNALIYGAGKPIELTVRSDVHGEAELHVRDFGMGLDAALQKRAFLRFERGVSAQHYGGLGLGLYIAKQVVDAHQGSIGVSSEPGAGATFWMRLPTGLARTVTASRSESEPPPSAPA